MQDFTMDELTGKVAERRERQKAYMREYMREQYQFARALGFSAIESSVLSGKGRDTIRRLAEERKG